MKRSTVVARLLLSRQYVSNQSQIAGVLREGESQLGLLPTEQRSEPLVLAGGLQSYSSAATRVERDTFGPLEVPGDRYVQSRLSIQVSEP